MSSNSESQEPLQERLKDQVSVSIKEALDKANTVLTNLHRVQSYLDVIRILSTHRSGDVIKNALEQIHAARNDTATLLQHIYLTEIGLQSLQVQCNVDLEGGVCMYVCMYVLVLNSYGICTPNSPTPHPPFHNSQGYAPQWLYLHLIFQVGVPEQALGWFSPYIG